MLPLNGILQVEVTRSRKHYVIKKQEEERSVEPSESFSTEQCGTREVYLLPGDVFLKEMQYEKKSTEIAIEIEIIQRKWSSTFTSVFFPKNSEQCRYFLSSMRHKNTLMYDAGLIASQLMLLVSWIPGLNLALSRPYPMPGIAVETFYYQTQGKSLLE